MLFSLRFVLLGASANLDSGGVERSVLVLPGADKDNVLEPVQAFKGAQLVQTGLFNISLITHT